MTADDSGGAVSTKRVRESGMRLTIGTAAAAAWLGMMAFLALAASFVSPYDPLEQDLLHTLQGPTAAHWFGTDGLGRDILTRLIYGTRPALLGVAIAVLVAVLVGTSAGVLAGYIRGRVDALANLFAELAQSVPGLIVLIALAAAVPFNVVALMSVLGLLLAAPVFRIVRNETLGVSSQLYVTAARLNGLSRLAIARRHLVPRIQRTILIQASTVGAVSLVTGVGLGFLGLDARPPDPTWGAMLRDAARSLPLTNQPLIFASLPVILTVLSLGVLGDRGSASSRRGRRRRADATEAASPGSAIGPAVTEPIGEAPSDAVLSVRGLNVHVDLDGGLVPIVEDVSFYVRRGETIGLVGESGAGKSITVRAVMGLLPPNAVVAGSAMFDGTDLLSLSERALNGFRGKRIGFIGQEPMVALDPTFRVGSQLREAVQSHRGLGRSEARQVAMDLLDQVRIPNPDQVLRRYPHELSGGMAQRVCIAKALAGEPDLLIADEPSTALDVSVQAEILDLLRDLSSAQGLAVLLVTHDWGVVADLCDRAVVLYAGQVAESAVIDSLFSSPAHPYTDALRAADPHNVEVGTRLLTIPGTVPRPGHWPNGCRFAPRCPYASNACEEPQALSLHGKAHVVRCVQPLSATQEAADA